MLVISRQEGGRVLLTVGHVQIWLTVLECGRGRTRLGLDAPQCVKIIREELLPPGECKPNPR